ncbi:MAG TPA: DUF5597 domain-containing protein [Candidatus Didemnitutus sp.]|nr:DUF5597 domain-containing protein [Candidatus Didemnitutus sp.]
MKIPSLLLGFVLSAPLAGASTSPLPQIVHHDGRHALLVDGRPYLILGVQAGNSSAWPAMLPKVWPAVEEVHANTLEIPVYWEQFEPQPGHFDPSVVDQILREAREHQVHLVLLWFGTWKNGSSHYLPLWMKDEPDKYPRLTGKNGKKVDSPTPFAPAMLEADTRAFRALMHHLRETDPQHTVLLVQVENEPGAWDTIRDYSPTAEKFFQAAVPPELLTALGKSAPAGANWPTVFGSDADEYFHAWYVAHYIGQVAAAGKAEYALPLYVNAALRDPINPPPAGNYESGGPTDNVIPIWKAAAPAIDILSPDIYMADGPRYQKVLELYSRPDNPLFVPETIGMGPLTRYCFAAIGHGAIGWSPFGIDFTTYGATPSGGTRLTEENLAPLALDFRLLAPMGREIARLNYEGKVQCAVEEKGAPVQTLGFGSWKAVVSYGVPAFGMHKDPKGNPEPIGRVLIAQTGPNDFLVGGYFCRVDFQPADSSAGRQREYRRVTEGVYENDAFRMLRIWNGDQTDYGLNFSSAPQVVQVQLGTY